jgi:putative hydrolase of the HAD superfamily
MLGLQAHGLIAQLLADLRPEPRMLAVVASARQAGVRVAVISNSWGSEPYDPYAGWRLASFADAVVISHEVGMRKPEPDIYRLACERIGLPPAACVLVDDIADNLPPARWLGMQIIHHIEVDATIGELERLLGL